MPIGCELVHLTSYIYISQFSQVSNHFEGVSRARDGFFLSQVSSIILMNLIHHGFLQYSLIQFSLLTICINIILSLVLVQSLVLLKKMVEQIPFSIVENVLGSLGSSVVQKLGSMYGVRNELEKMEETLGTLNAVLLDAEDQLEKSHAVKDWVKRLKRVVYAVDDLLDDYAAYRLRRGGPARQVSHVFSCSSSNQAAFRFHMSGKVDDIKVALDDIKKDIFLLSAIPRNTIHPRGHNNTRRETHSSPSSTYINLDLRNAELEKIVNLLVSPDNEDIFIVVICGIGGLGKTNLAQLVFNDERVTKHFEPKKWVCVSDDHSGEGFGEKALLKKITNSENDKSEVEDLKKTLDKNLS